MGQLGGITLVVLFLWAIVIAIAWILLPIALIGTKPLLRELIVEARRNNALLERLVMGLRPPSSGSALVRDGTPVVEPSPAALAAKGKTFSKGESWLIAAIALLAVIILIIYGGRF